MWRTVTSAIILAGAALAGGCASGGPMLENPLVVGPPPPALHNPVYLPQGPEAYGQLFLMVVDVVDDYFDIQYSNRYDGRIVTLPRIAPGIGQPWKAGSHDFHERLLATFQSIRQHAEIVIEPAPLGGYNVYVTVYKEIEDLDRPAVATAGAAAFRSDPSIQRQEEIVGPGATGTHWVPRGRDTHLEQVILDRIQNWDKPVCR
jgi:hypothetical protein